MKLNIIVNGTQVSIMVNPLKNLSESLKSAMDISGVVGRRLTDFLPLFGDEVLQPDYAICDQRKLNKKGLRKNKKIPIGEDDTIFLSLKTGVGA